MSIANITGTQTLRVLVNVLSSSLPSHLTTPCTSPHTKWLNCKEDGAISVKLKSSAAKEKGRRPVKEDKKKRRKFESNKKKRAFNLSWKESFSCLQHHVMNSEGKMFCDICRRHDRSGSFSVGNTNFKPKTLKAKEGRLKQSLAGRLTWATKLCFGLVNFRNHQPGGYSYSWSDVEPCISYPKSSWFLLRQTREKPLRATVSPFELTAVQRHGRIN